MAVNNRDWKIYLDCYFKVRKTAHSISHGAIISLWNANGQIASLAKNRVLSNKVVRNIKMRELNYVTIWGGNKTMEYRELSVLVECDYLVAIEIARLAKQNAFYILYSDQRLRLVDCDTEKSEYLKSTFLSRQVKSALAPANLALD